MHITFLQDWQQYEKGETYDVASPTARRAIGQGAADHTTNVKERIGRHPSDVGDLETATRQPAENAAERTEPPQARDAYQVEHRGGPWYDVLGPDGDAVNDKALRRGDADELKAELEG